MCRTSSTVITSRTLVAQSDKAALIASGAPIG
jgi:hypothetical protein